MEGRAGAGDSVPPSGSIPPGGSGAAASIAPAPPFASLPAPPQTGLHGGDQAQCGTSPLPDHRYGR